MIQLIDRDGLKTFVVPSAIASIAETGSTSQWHGIRAVVQLFDGRTIEVTQTAQEIARLLETVT